MIINKVKQIIDIKEVINRYSTSPLNKNNKTICPFHHDTTPSLSVKGQRFKCFVCGTSGDAIDFVAKLYNLSPLEAAKLINSDFGLGFDAVNKTDYSKIKEEQRKRKIAKEKALLEQKKNDFVYNCLCDIYKAKQDILNQHNKKSIPTKEFINAYNVVQYLDYFFDLPEEKQNLINAKYLEEIR